MVCNNHLHHIQLHSKYMQAIIRRLRLLWISSSEVKRGGGSRFSGTLPSSKSSLSSTYHFSVCSSPSVRFTTSTARLSFSISPLSVGARSRAKLRMTSSSPVFRVQRALVVEVFEAGQVLGLPEEQSEEVEVHFANHVIFWDELVRKCVCGQLCHTGTQS